MSDPIQTPPAPLVPPMPRPAATMTQAERQYEIRELRLHPAYFDGTTDPARHDAVINRYRELVDAEPGTPPPASVRDPQDQVPAKPDGYKVDVSLFGGDRWPEADRGAFYQVAHGQRLTHRQAEMLMKFRASHAPSIDRDGISDGLIHAYGALARALGLTERQAVTIAKWFENGPEQVPGHARR